MTLCISITNLSSRGEYPVIDPRRVAGPGPFRFGYNLAHDALVVGVARNPKLSHCEMRVNLVTSLVEGKDILAWNFFSATNVGRIGSAALGLPSSMKIRRSSSMGLSCGQGTDTVVLRRRDAAFGNWTAWYLLQTPDFWDFWGGCDVTFDWFSDTNRGLWADQIPAPSYPIVGLPDNTLMVDNAGKFSLVFGGTDFAVPASLVGLLGVWGLSPSFAIPSRPLPPTPTDFTLVQELFTPEMYVIYGGAWFRIPDIFTLADLGFSLSQVRALPPGGTAKLRKVPIDGTLLRGLHTQKVYLAENGKLRRVTSKATMQRRCLPWRHVRVVPKNALAALKKGKDLGPSG
jgi:hypothetical protein